VSIAAPARAKKPRFLRNATCGYRRTLMLPSLALESFLALTACLIAGVRGELETVEVFFGQPRSIAFWPRPTHGQVRPAASAF